MAPQWLSGVIILMDIAGMLCSLGLVLELMCNELSHFVAMVTFPLGFDTLFWLVQRRCNANITLSTVNIYVALTVQMMFAGFGPANVADEPKKDIKCLLDCLSIIFATFSAVLNLWASSYADENNQNVAPRRSSHCLSYTSISLDTAGITCSLLLVLVLMLSDFPNFAAAWNTVPYGFLLTIVGVFCFTNAQIDLPAINTYSALVVQMMFAGFGPNNVAREPAQGWKTLFDFLSIMFASLALLANLISDSEKGEKLVQEACC